MPPKPAVKTKSDPYKENLRILSTTTPKALVQAVLSGSGVKKKLR